MTEDEKDVLDALAQAWNKYLRLEVYNTDDRQDFRGAIHAAQNIVLARAGTRILARTETVAHKSPLHSVGETAVNQEDA